MILDGCQLHLVKGLFFSDEITLTCGCLCCSRTADIVRFNWPCEWSFGGERSLLAGIKRGGKQVLPSGGRKEGLLKARALPTPGSSMLMSTSGYKLIKPQQKRQIKIGSAFKPGFLGFQCHFSPGCRSPW